MAKATPTEQQPPTAQDYLVMMRNASEALEGLRKQISATEDKLHEQTRMITALDQQQQDAEQHIASLEQEIVQTQREVAQTQATLTLTKGMVAATKEAEASIIAFKEHLALLEKEREEARTNAEGARIHYVEDRREHETRRAELQAALEELHSQYKHLEKEQSRFYTLAGAALYGQRKEEIDALAQRVEQARTDLAAQEQALQYARAEVPRSLELWPELVLQARRELLPRDLEDYTTQTLRAGIHFVDMLAEHGPSVRSAFPNRNLSTELGIPLTSMQALFGYAPPPRGWGGNPPMRDDIARQHRNMFQGLLNAHKVELAERIEGVLRSEEKRLQRQKGTIIDE